MRLIAVLRLLGAIGVAVAIAAVVVLGSRSDAPAPEVVAPIVLAVISIMSIVGLTLASRT